MKKNNSNNSGWSLHCITAILTLFCLQNNISAQVVNSGNLYISPSASIYIKGNYKNAAGAIIRNDGNYYTSGDFVSNQANGQAGSGTIYFKGSRPQLIKGTATAVFYNVVVNNSGGGVNLETDISVNNNLAFTRGLINTSGFKVIIPDGSSVSNVSQNTGWVNGNLEKYILSGTNISQNFELGDNLYYTPASLNFSNVNTAGNILANVVNTDHPNIATSDINPFKSVNRYWSFINNSTVFNNVSATFNWVVSDVDAGATVSSFHTAGYSSAWTNYSTSVPSSNSITTSGINALGSFAAGEYSCTGSAPAKPGNATSGQQFNLCPGGIFTYTIDPVPGATFYTWNVPPSFSVVADNGTSVTLNIPAGIDRERLLVSAGNACGSSPAKIINLFGKPSKPVISGSACVRAYQTGLIYTVTNAEPNVSYTWKVPGIVRITSGQGTSTITVDWRAYGGTILAVPQNSCWVGTRAAYPVSVGNCNAVAKNDNTKSKLFAYPNPASGTVTVLFTNSKTEKSTLVITDISGKQLMSKEITVTAGTNKIMLDIRNYPDGLFMISLKTTEGVQSIKIVKQ